MVPNANTVLTLGILSIIFLILIAINPSANFWFLSNAFISLILGIIALILSRKGSKALVANRNLYSKGSIGIRTAGKIIAIIGTVLSAICIIIVIIIIAYLAAKISSY